MKYQVNVSDERIDKYLANNTNYSRSLISKMLKNGNILVNNEKVKPNYKVNLNDEITIMEYQNESTLTPEEMPLNIVYEDNDIMVINKDSGVVVHPGSGHHEHTLANGLLYYTNNLSDKDLLRPGIVHRLDKDTSGLMLVAKSNQAHEILTEDFKNHNVKRTYLAIICGEFPHNEATIDAPIGRDSKNRQKMAVTDINSKKAITHLQVLKRYHGYTLIKLNLETGRTHQIRVHLSYIGYPILNDPLYNKKNATSYGQYLHSSTISFIHPITKEKMHFEVDLPKPFQDKLKELEPIEN